MAFPLRVMRGRKETLGGFRVACAELALAFEACCFRHLAGARKRLAYDTCAVTRKAGAGLCVRRSGAP